MCYCANVCRICRQYFQNFGSFSLYFQPTLVFPSIYLPTKTISKVLPHLWQVSWKGCPLLSTSNIYCKAAGMCQWEVAGPERQGRAQHNPWAHTDLQAGHGLSSSSSSTSNSKDPSEKALSQQPQCPGQCGGASCSSPTGARRAVRSWGCSEGRGSQGLG